MTNSAKWPLHGNYSMTNFAQWPLHENYYIRTSYLILRTRISNTSYLLPPTSHFKLLGVALGVGLGVGKAGMQMPEYQRDKSRVSRVSHMFYAIYARVSIAYVVNRNRYT
jgi:hypothetical protein